MYTSLSDKSEDERREDYDTLLHESERILEPSRRKLIWLSVLFIPLICFSLIGLGVAIGRNFLVNKASLCPAYVQHYCEISSPKLFSA